MGRTLPRTVVITGASSGIGRATALAFAERGDHVVVAARRATALMELEAQCRARGGEALAVPTDVTEEEEVLALARVAVERFGTIDVWVNDAAVYAYGPFEALPIEVFRRVIETNLLGTVYGARAALHRFRNQGRGTLINIASIVARLSEPYSTAYVAAKHAVRGFSQSLRQELLLEGELHIHVCVVMPAVVDTPLFQHAANYSGRALDTPPPVYPPERVARAVVTLSRRPRRERFVGSSGRLLDLLSRVVPGAVERQSARGAARGHLQARPAAPTAGNLFAPLPISTPSGGWKPRGARRIGRAALLGAALLVPLAPLLYARHRRARRGAAWLRAAGAARRPMRASRRAWRSRAG